MINQSKPNIFGVIYDSQCENVFKAGHGAVYDPQNIAPTLVTATGGGNKPMSIDKKKFRIRKLTPTECMRLMSVPDEDIQKVKDIGMSDSQMYKQAGNSLVSNCVELIFEHLFKAQYQEDFKCYDENFQ